MEKYGIILADPPWQYRDTTCQGATPYAGMDLHALCSLPVERIAATDAFLFLWCTGPKGCEGAHVKVMEAWGFIPITKAFVWVKTTSTNRPFIGTGHYTRSNSEDCWLGKRGKPQCHNHGISQVQFHQPSNHSKKPAKFRELIVKLAGDLPRVELFARQQVPGWDRWGNEVISTPELFDLFKPWYVPSPNPIVQFRTLPFLSKSSPIPSVSTTTSISTGEGLPTQRKTTPLPPTATDPGPTLHMVVSVEGEFPTRGLTLPKIRQNGGQST